MPDTDKKATDKPVKETEVKETEVKETKVEPKAEETVVSPAASTDSAAAPAGTDQLGRQLYDVKCAKCGKQTQVPFKPSGDRPVYCRDCYMEQRGGASGGPRR